MLSFVMSRMDTEEALLSVCDIPRLLSSLGNAESMLDTVGEVVQGVIEGNDDVPPGMLGFDCHGTHAMVDNATLGTVPEEQLQGKPFFGALNTFTEVFRRLGRLS